MYTVTERRFGEDAKVRRARTADGAIGAAVRMATDVMMGDRVGVSIAAVQGEAEYVSSSFSRDLSAGRRRVSWCAPDTDAAVIVEVVS